MPNWCSNGIELKGDVNHRREFVDKNKGYSMWDTTKVNEYHALSFHASVPCLKKHISVSLKVRSEVTALPPVAICPEKIPLFL